MSTPPGPPSEPRPPFSLPELLELLQNEKLLTAKQASDIESRATTLRSRVLKDRVGSIRSQAAARYEVSPAEIVSAAALPNARRSHRRLDEDAIAEALAQAADLPYRKIDPLQLDNELITKSLSRPFVRRHVVIPVEQDAEAMLLAITDQFDSALL